MSDESYRKGPDAAISARSHQRYLHYLVAFIPHLSLVSELGFHGDDNDQIATVHHLTPRHHNGQIVVQFAAVSTSSSREHDENTSSKTNRDYF